MFIENTTNELAERIKSLRIKPNKKGLIAFKSEKVDTLIATLKKTVAKEKEINLNQASFVLNYNTEKAYLNGKEFDLTTHTKELKKKKLHYSRSIWMVLIHLLATQKG